MVTFDLKIFKIIKNSLIFSLLGIKRNILAFLGIIILVFFEASWDTCYNQMKQRRRQLPYSIMISKWERWERPTVELDGKFWKRIYRGNYNTKEQ